MKELKLQVYWMPNLITGFTHAIKNMAQGYYALEILSGLDLEEGGEIIKTAEEDFPELKIFGENLKIAYKAFRRKFAINSPFCIEMNAGGVEIFYDCDGEGVSDWYSWSLESEDNYFDNFDDYVEFLKKSSDWKDKLRADSCEYISEYLVSGTE